MLEDVQREAEARQRFTSSQRVELENVGFIATDDGKQAYKAQVQQG